MDIEHLCFLSWFCGHESHEQDGEKLRGRKFRDLSQRPAILP
jgi:hypothetical protein